MQIDPLSDLSWLTSVPMLGESKNAFLVTPVTNPWKMHEGASERRQPLLEKPGVHRESLLNCVLGG